MAPTTLVPTQPVTKVYTWRKRWNPHRSAALGPEGLATSQTKAEMLSYSGETQLHQGSCPSTLALKRSVMAIEQRRSPYLTDSGHGPFSSSSASHQGSSCQHTLEKMQPMLTSDPALPTNPLGTADCTGTLSYKDTPLSLGKVTFSSNFIELGKLKWEERRICLKWKSKKITSMKKR